MEKLKTLSIAGSHLSQKRLLSMIGVDADEKSFKQIINIAKN